MMTTEDEKKERQKHEILAKNGQKQNNGFVKLTSKLSREQGRQAGQGHAHKNDDEINGRQHSCYCRFRKLFRLSEECTTDP